MQSHSYEELEAINAEVNAIPWRHDFSEDWRPASPDFQWMVNGASCHNFATGKLVKLVASGWDLKADNIRLATCKVDADVENHVVLLVDFAGETHCLDNRYERVKLKDMLPYVWVREQIAGTPEWITTGD